MQFLSIFMISIGLSMDAFAVSLSNGMGTEGTGIKKALKIGVAFGFFQGIMPLIGYFLSGYFHEFISTYAKYISLILLGMIGIKMILEGLKENQEEKSRKSTLTLQLLLMQSVATSIDAMVVGVSFLATGTPIFSASLFIGVMTFTLSTVGALLGSNFGALFGKKAEILGGAILFFIGIRTFFMG